LISGLKDKIREFEVDNESLANENEELRQFSLDGYQIAKNVQSLGNERERLSVDLADKANTIKKLLDENETLSHRLRDAQVNA
jgi:predicted RNase H-like nuclease (RuvC/YqgF family)